MPCVPRMRIHRLLLVANGIDSRIHNIQHTTRHYEWQSERRISQIARAQTLAETAMKRITKKHCERIAYHENYLEKASLSSQ